MYQEWISEIIDELKTLMAMGDADALELINEHEGFLFKAWGRDMAPEKIAIEIVRKSC